MSSKKKSGDLVKIFREKIPVYRKDPELFGREVCRFEPDTWQQLVFKYTLSLHDALPI